MKTPLLVWTKGFFDASNGLTVVFTDDSQDSQKQTNKTDKLEEFMKVLSVALLSPKRDSYQASWDVRK